MALRDEDLAVPEISTYTDAKKTEYEKRVDPKVYEKAGRIQTRISKEQIQGKAKKIEYEKSVGAKAYEKAGLIQTRDQTKKVVYEKRADPKSPYLLREYSSSSRSETCICLSSLEIQAIALRDIDSASRRHEHIPICRTKKSDDPKVYEKAGLQRTRDHTQRRVDSKVYEKADLGKQARPRRLSMKVARRPSTIVDPKVKYEMNLVKPLYLLSQYHSSASSETCKCLRESGLRRTNGQTKKSDDTKAYEKAVLSKPEAGPRGVDPEVYEKADLRRSKGQRVDLRRSKGQRVDLKIYEMTGQRRIRGQTKKIEYEMTTKVEIRHS
ncbi:hypothetical protein EJ06DRAFT_524493 [Trichodelitschia bisporula]|uniref:Uncharacterized protein n=1 Tax=Trichodelitschia bisporula TaxID=703511 RepID=A0A6G1HKH5_9PEZI|nr:hypothetical protein EJ06DRAFT_524493 [Trichodelitschia bisporula]